MTIQRKFLSIILDYLERDIIENPDKLIPLSRFYLELRNDLVAQHGDQLNDLGLGYLLTEGLTNDDVMIFFADMVDEGHDPDNPTDWSELIDHELSDEEREALNAPLGDFVREMIANRKKNNA